MPTDDSPTDSREGRHSNWYLGIDFGSTGLSAALADRASRQVYPIFWQARQAPEAPQNDDSDVGRSYRIPSVAAIEEPDTTAGQFLLQNFKLLLKVGIPDRSLATGMYEPVFQLSQDRALSIASPLQGLRALLATLNPRKQAQTLGNQEGLAVPDLICSAALGDSLTVSEVLQDLEGVILGTPADWSDAYRFNLREAVLGAGLVGDSSQIFVVEDAIATLLSAVTAVANLNLTPGRSGEPIGDEPASASPRALDDFSLSGGTLILNAGAATVELALVDLPENLQDLTYADFTCQSLAFAGNAFDQDIICQLLASMFSKKETFGMPIDLPRPGHPDLPSRYQLQQCLQSSAFGQQLLAAARDLKVILQHQESFVLDLGQQRLEVKRRDLENQVLVPFVQQLNRELNAMLCRVGMSPVGINQVICTGGMGSWPSLTRWLRQKLPNARVIQDRELDAAPEVSPVPNSGLKSTDFNLKICRVACGLASLALYPQILDVPRQQYSDFFLLWELMEVLGPETLSFEEIVQLLECQGVFTRTCESRILKILEGRLPAGLLPAPEDLMLLAEESRQNHYWEVISAEPLFLEDVDRGFRLNVEQAAVVREYLSKLASSSQQQLLEPLTIALDARTEISR